MTVSFQNAAPVGPKPGPAAQGQSSAPGRSGDGFATLISAAVKPDETRDDGSAAPAGKSKGRKPAGADEAPATVGVPAAMQVPAVLAAQPQSAQAEAAETGQAATPIAGPPAAGEMSGKHKPASLIGALPGADIAAEAGSAGGDPSGPTTVGGGATRPSGSDASSSPQSSQQTSTPAQAAVAASGATEIVAKSVADGPPLAPPSKQAPPVAGPAGAGGARATSGAETTTDVDEKSGQAAAPGGVSPTERKPGKDADPSKAEGVKAADAAQAASSRADAAGAAADRPFAPPQTAAAPATPSGQIPQAASASAAQLAAPVVAQVANEIVAQAASRRTRFEVRLDPDELGRVDVRLDVGNDGRVATRLIVERPETLDMLRNDARELARTLEQAGFQLGQGGLAFQLRDGRSQGWTRDAEQISATRNASAEDIPAAVADVYARSPRGAGGLDVTV